MLQGGYHDLRVADVEKAHLRWSLQPRCRALTAPCCLLDLDPAALFSLVSVIPAGQVCPQSRLVFSRLPEVLSPLSTFRAGAQLSLEWGLL